MPAGPGTDEAHQRLWRVRVAAPYQSGSTESARPRSVDQVLGRPPVEVVLRHAGLRELFPSVVLTRGEGAEQRVAADLLVAARVVDLVQLVPAAELGAHRVPQELHELDALDGVDAARAAEVAIEVTPEIRRLEVARMRVEVDEPARHRLLDEVLDLHIRFGGQHLIRSGWLHSGKDAAARPGIRRLGHR